MITVAAPPNPKTDPLYGAMVRISVARKQKQFFYFFELVFSQIWFILDASFFRLK